jgi:hypothetical protein
MELSSAVDWSEWGEFEDDLPCIAREECVRSFLGDAAADTLSRWPWDTGEGEDE